MVQSLLGMRTLRRICPTGLRLQSNKQYTQLSNCQQRSFSFRTSIDSAPYAFTHGKWQVFSNQHPLCWWPKIGCVTYNVNHVAPYGPERMKVALEYLESICLDKTFPEVPLFINFQEVTPSSLNIIKKASWIQAYFQLTNVTGTDRSRSFGTATLIDRRLPIASVTRVPLVSKTGRDALFVDIQLGSPSIPHPVIIRLCNVHLESSNRIPRRRPDQFALISKYLRSDFVHAGIAAGDFNAVDKIHDANLHLLYDLKDAHLEHGGKERGNSTWDTLGSNDQRNTGRKKPRYPSARLDKILHTGEVLVDKPQLIAKNLMLGDPADQRYVSDHRGLKTVLRFE